jgi:hypothetical protein
VCYEPTCWLLKDPHDKGSIYLPKKFLVSSTSESIKKQRRVQIRHVLFQIAYGEVLPPGRVTRMRCGHNHCINPAHIKIPNWHPSYGSVRKMLTQGWLTEEEADEWFAGITEQTEAEQSAKPSTENIKTDAENHPKWEAIYPAAHD